MKNSKYFYTPSVLISPSVPHTFSSHSLNCVCGKATPWKQQCSTKKQKTKLTGTECWAFTWAPSLSGWSSSSSGSDAPRWPGNTERSLTLNQSDGEPQPARAADQPQITRLRLITPRKVRSAGLMCTTRGRHIYCLYLSDEVEWIYCKGKVGLGVVGLLPSVAFV